MNCLMFHPVAFRKWDYTTPDTEGIGGSETSQIELAWRLARRGHRVISYAPVPWTGPKFSRGVEWRPLEEADFSQPGIWLLYRCPDALDKFTADHLDQKLWLISQDEHYDTWNEERLAKLDRFVALCKTHAASHRRSYHGLGDKIWISSNGIRVDMIREIEQEKIARNPRKLIYASSPDRGLQALLKIFKRAREWVSDLELHVFYGFDNIDKLIALSPAYSHFAKIKAEIIALAQQPGVVWRGCTNQRDLCREWFSAGIWAHPSLFTETSCCVCMDAQACGAIPITTPTWAVGENVMHGIFIDGDCWTDPLVQARFVGEIYRLATNTALQDEIRPQMMKDARMRFNWERIADQLESWMYGFDNGKHEVYSQNIFQLKHAKGRILNIGCERDLVNLKAIGAVNLDVCERHPTLDYDFKTDVVHDAREPLPAHIGTFDSVVCFPAGTVVSGHHLPIEALSESHTVRSSSGIEQRITRKFVRQYRGTMVKIKTACLPSVEMTAEHPVLVTECTRIHRATNRAGQRSIFDHVYSEPRWKPASEVHKGDWLIAPRNAMFSEQSIALRIGRRRHNNIDARAERNFPLGYQLAKLIGLWAAEGSVTPPYRAYFHFGGHESELHEELRLLCREALGLKLYVPDKIKKGNTKSCILYNKDFVTWLSKNVGRGALYKRVPPQIEFGSIESARGFIDGMVAGDGDLNNTSCGSERIRIKTSSRRMAYGLLDLLFKIGIPAGLGPIKGTGLTDWGGRLVMCRDRYEVRFGRRYWLGLQDRAGKAAQSSLRVFDEFVGLPVRKVETREGSETVFNIETEDHTYCVPFIVHNCGDILEHMDYQDAVLVLRNAAMVLSPEGRVVITCPDDHRSRDEQNPYGQEQTDEYVGGVRGYHRPRPLEELRTIISEAGLEPTFEQPIDYGFFQGWGIVAATSGSVREEPAAECEEALC